MNYTFHQLQIFLKVVQTGSITKSADELHLTQPAVSIQLRNLQEQFDIPLTETVGRKLYITDFGREIAGLAEKILEQVQSIDSRTQAYKGRLFGQLKIATVSTGKYVMPYFLSGFMDKHPDINLRMDVTNKAQVLENLERNEVDFALVSLVPTHLHIEKIDLLPNKLYLVGKQAPKSKTNQIPVDLLETMPLIFRESGSGTRQIMEKFINSKGIVFKKKMELTSNEAVKQALLAGLGISIMPLIGIRNEIRNKDLHILPHKGLPIQTNWSLIWLKGKRHSPVAQAYLEELIDYKDQLIQRHFEWVLKQK